MTIENILIFIGIIALFLLEAIFEVAVLSALGAFTRRTFGSKQKSFKEYYNESKIVNSVLGLTTLIAIVAIIVSVIRIFAE